MNNKQPLLLDALYINAGGGLNLLEYLLEVLVKNKLDVCLLKDSRCRKLSCEDKLFQVYEMKASLYGRYKFYYRYRERFRLVFCFANIPAPIKMPCPVYTYFHNANLLDVPARLSVLHKILNYGKQLIIKALSKNSDTWIVQTQNMALLLKNVIRTENEVLVMPFYRPPINHDLSVQRNDYILVGNYTGTRGHEELLQAWEELLMKGRRPVLHLTVDNEAFIALINHAVDKGANIINHGIISFEEISQLYARCKATIYPSVNESLGLGIIEALESGCDVIAPDLPYVWSVCVPSEVFDLQDIDTMINAVIKYDDGKSERSVLTINNEIDELINLLR